jgi:hypothetical protein
MWTPVTIPVTLALQFVVEHTSDLRELMISGLAKPMAT